MTAVDEDRTLATRVRPKRGLIRSGLLMLLIVPLPMFGTLFVLGMRSGSWPVAVGGELLCLLLGGVSVWLLRRAYVGVSANSVVERGFFGRVTSAPTSNIHTMVLAMTYRGSSSEILPQLILLDESGGRLLRLRGIFWTENAMRTVADAIDCALETPAETMTEREFFERYEGSAYWFENRPRLAIGAIVLAIVICGFIALGLMRLLGLPIAGSS